MLILLPPSEGKAAARRGASLALASLSHPALTQARSEVVDALVTLCVEAPEKAAEILAVPKTQLELVGRNAALLSAPTARADAVYTGVLYDALSFGTLSAAAKRRASSRVLVTSSLFGLVGPGDRIPSYRLSGDASLPGLGGVAAHWRRHLGSVLDDAGFVMDLRSSVYAGFWKPSPGTATVRVLHEVNGTRKVVSHFNKATKGRLVRALLEDGANPRNAARLAEALSDLGWTVERDGAQLDVIVREL